MKKWKFTSAILAIALMLGACGTTEEGSTAEGTNETAVVENETTASGNEAAGEEATGEETAVESSTYPLTVSPTVGSSESEENGTINFDDVTFEKMPEKVVVFDYGFLDTLNALGVEGIVGVAKDSTLPAHLEKFASDDYVSVGGLKSPLLEDIAELEPDVIFISGRQSAYYEELKEIAPVLFVGTQQDDYWNTFLASVDTAAKIFGKEAEAKEYTAKFDAALEEINTLAGSFETSLVTMYNEGNLSGFASESRFGYMYEVYGFKPVTEDIESSSHGSNFGFEAILEFNPDVLFVIDRTAATGGESNIEADMENDIIKKTTAYQNNRVVYLDGPLWYLSGGGLESELAKIEEVLAELK
ncbi:siderophore ABC transporter substrate-binding protein [Paenibacillus urinalis]|uniref:siderophore ABC transporter substrate-binding protein n=1 Tax=Paenibacillus TaxID=44249 RepID=UPI0004D971CB|nr:MULTISPECIES: siderophore ABC transporter substrate-binding protein [Paenibacillus]WDH98652.1 siderophore ABC transporter substrate-binding protein [Paenibacillus urinalis]GAK41574.1 ferrichrome ABC transporter ferrichrome-binding protein [Paenibacillus sp. TCA20]